jgi:DNA-directed RNA polymerase beta' subunit
MAFKLLDVPNFIQKVKAKAVTNPRTFNQNMEPHDNGLQSKSIFGVSTSDKFNLWGYINLEDVVMHPLVLDNISHIDPVFNRVYTKSKKYKVANGMLVETDSGSTGIGWLIGVWDKINFDKYRTEKNKMFVDFIKNTKKNLIFINRIPVIPIVYREARMGKFKPEEDEVDALYKKILSFSKTGRSDFTASFMEAIKDKTNKDFVQEAVNNLYQHFINKLESKQGFVRGALTSKRLDNVSRMVANANPDIPINACVIPWQILLNMYDVFVVAFLNSEGNEELKTKLGIGEKSMEEYGDLFDYIYRNTDTYTDHYPTHKAVWIDILTNIFNENPMMRVLVKRDPGWNANSLHCFRPLIGTENMYHILVPSWVYKPLGGDSFNTNFMIDTLNDNVIYEDNNYKIVGENEHARVVKTMDCVWRRLENE